MKIIHSSLGMEATSVYREVNKGEGALAATGGKGDPAVEFRFDRFQFEPPGASAGYLQLAANLERYGLHAVSSVMAPDHLSAHDCSEEKVVERLIAEVIGRQVRIRELRRPVGGGNAGANLAGGRSGGRGPLFSAAAGLQVRLGLRQMQYRQEALSVNSSGTIVTADGREISFTLELLLERKEVFLQQSFMRSISSRFIDPLVLSFNDGLAMLGDSTFSFDLNGDGEDEEIDCLGSGSGFLALDRDGDGLISGGRELFGPRTGYGYEELSIYDLDGNTWIDENDPVFDQLQLWMGAGSETGRLVSLREAGVGALSLASADAHFHLKDSQGRITGQIRQSGLFVMENGEVRPMAELDLLVPKEGEPASLAGFSPGMRLALENLRDMIAMHRRRLTNLAVFQLRADREEKQGDRLLRRLLELRPDRPEVKSA